jgi:hypothetical protein
MSLEEEARDAEVRERVFAIVRAVADTLVADGVATLDWLEPDPETGLGPGARLTPARADAITVEILPEWRYVIVHFVRDVPGSYWGVTEDLQPDPDGPHPDWEDQLRQMLLGVTEGGLTELIEPERHEYLRTLTFKQPHGEDLERPASYFGKAEAHEIDFPGYR